MVPLMKASPRDGSFALASLGNLRRVHEPILNSLVSKRIVGIIRLWLALFEQVATYHEAASFAYFEPAINKLCLFFRLSFSF